MPTKIIVESEKFPLTIVKINAFMNNITRYGADVNNTKIEVSRRYKPKDFPNDWDTVLKAEIEVTE